jgi:uncharacterized membrane protein
MNQDSDSPALDTRGLAKNRTEALADAIFAVAMTLLVLDIKSPENRHFGTTSSLVDYLLTLEHSFAMYAISFFVLAIFWVAHHVLFHYVQHVDRRLLWINIVFLLLVTFVPFSTDLLGDHGHLMLPVIVYGLNLLALGGLLVLHLRYLVARRELATPDLNATVVVHMRRDIRAYALIPLVSMAVSLVSPRTAMYTYLLLALPIFAPSRLDRLLYPGAASRAESSSDKK